MNKNDLPNELKNLFPIVDALSQMFGESHYEFVAHDFRFPESSLCYIKGNVTGRNIGAPLTDRLLSIYRREGDDAKDVINLITLTDKGKTIKSSSIFIKDSKGKIIGSLGINIDISDSERIADLFSVLNLKINTESHKLSSTIDFADDVNMILSDLMNQSIAKCEKAPEFLTKEERIELLEDMEQKGVFLIKGAVEEAAKRLGVSIYTIYNHLEEIRKKSSSGKEGSK